MPAAGNFSGKPPSHTLRPVIAISCSRHKHPCRCRNISFPESKVIVARENISTGRNIYLLQVSILFLARDIFPLRNNFNFGREICFFRNPKLLFAREIFPPPEKIYLFSFRFYFWAEIILHPENGLNSSSAIYLFRNAKSFSGEKYSLL